MSGPGREFRCEVCLNVCHTHVPVEEVVAEAEAVFGPVPADRSKVSSVCDDCYPKVMAWAADRGLPRRWEF